MLKTKKQLIEEYYAPNSEADATCKYCSDTGVCDDDSFCDCCADPDRKHNIPVEIRREYNLSEL